MATKLTVSKIENMKVGSEFSESVDSCGSLSVKRTESSRSFYFRSQKDGRQVRVKLGVFPSMSLVSARNIARDMSNKARENFDLKFALAEERRKKTDEQQAIQRQRELDARQGSLTDLFASYISSMERNGRSSSNKVKSLLHYHVENEFPTISAKPAREVTRDDIVYVLRHVMEKGVTTNANRLRSYIMAAFNFGLRCDNDPLFHVVDGKKFGLLFNPVDGIPVQQSFEKQRERVLSQKELHHFWYHFADTPKVGFLIQSLLRFVIALGGQRPNQVLQCRWSDVDEIRKTITIMDAKGRGVSARQHVVPLSDIALDIIQSLKPLTADYQWLFSHSGKAPITIAAVSRAVSRYHEYFQHSLQIESLELFVAKDLRRTCKMILIDAGVNREERNLLQNHALTGIDFKHYDYSDHLSEKLNAINKYTFLLHELLRP